MRLVRQFHKRVNLFICQPYIFELIRCKQLTFCCFLSENNMLSFKGEREINISTYLSLKWPFLSLRAA